MFSNVWDTDGTGSREVDSTRRHAAILYDNIARRVTVYAKASSSKPMSTALTSSAKQCVSNITRRRIPS